MDDTERDKNETNNEEPEPADSDNHPDKTKTQDNKHRIPPEANNSRLREAGFLASLGKSVKIYWKIGVHWLSALRDLFGLPFDERARRILQSSA